jgi:hypothetical protein
VIAMGPSTIGQNMKVQPCVKYRALLGISSTAVAMAIQLAVAVARMFLEVSDLLGQLLSKYL